MVKYGTYDVVIIIYQIQNRTVITQLTDWSVRLTWLSQRGKGALKNIGRTMTRLLIGRTNYFQFSDWTAGRRRHLSQIKRY